MKEHILIKFKRDRKALPVKEVRTKELEPHENGIVLNRETSAFPRDFYLGLYPRQTIRQRFRTVQQRHDWLNPSRFEVKIKECHEQLRIEGVDDRSLPPGPYTLKINVDGLDLKNTRRSISIPKDGSDTVTFEAKKEKLKLELNTSVQKFDDNSRRILNHPKSKLDTLPAAEWLMTDNSQDRRKAALLNIFAKLNAIPVARKNESLSCLVKHVFHAEVDRIYCAVKPEFLEIVRKCFNPDVLVLSTHARLLSRIPSPSGQLINTYKLKSYRENVATSLQVVVAKPEHESPDTLYVDLDIDKSNPNYDVLRFMRHVRDVINSKRTNHLKLRSKLVNGDTGDFLYYDVVKA